MKVAYITLNHKGGMIHYVSQLLNAISSEIEPVLITGMIADQKPGLQKSQNLQFFTKNSLDELMKVKKICVSMK